MEADIWLNFGSFLYGLTGEIIAYDSSSLVLRLGGQPNLSSGQSNEFKNELKEAKNFVDLLKSKSNHLLFTEVRVYYAPGQPLKVVKLSTALCPVAKNDEMPHLELTLQNLCPVTPLDAQLWQELTEKIWPLLTD